MIDYISLHYGVIALTVALSVFSVGFGQSKATVGLLQALNHQPAAHQQLSFLFLLGMAMLEFIGILAVFTGILLLMNIPETMSMLLCYTGAACALLIPSIVVGIASAYPLSEIFMALARQPLLYPQLLRQLLFTQIMLQTPTLFGFVITLLLFSKAVSTLSITAGLKLCATGLMFGLGVIGPTLGIALLATEACYRIGLNKNVVDKIFSFTLISQGVIETPVLLVVMLSLFMMFTSISSGMYAGIVYLATALCMGCINLSSGINSGITARSSCQQINQYPQEYSNISNANLITLTFIETSVIYGMIIVFMILFSLPV